MIDRLFNTPQIVRDVILLVARVGLGIILIAHGWQKYFDTGMSQVGGGFEQMGIPLPTVSAYFTGTVELLGGLALVLGLFVPVAGVLVAFVMAGAFVFVHAKAGVFAPQGFELVLSIGLAAILVAAFGSGRIGLDHMLFRKRAEEAQAL